MVDSELGRVVVSYSQDSIVEDAAGRLYRCVSRRSSGKVVCGDYVRWSETGAEAGVIESIEPRRNEVARPNYRNDLRPIAANVDVLIVVVAVRPPFERELIDRYLVLAEHLGVEARIWLNKIDLAGPQREAYAADLAPYEALGYPVMLGSTKTGAGIAELQEALRGKTGILVGQSGVGKSSVASALLPDMELRVGALSHASGLGRHTTTETTLYHIPSGGELIDSPGIRTLRLSHLSPSQVQQGFRELRPYLDQCRFSDCRHRAEPGCAINAAQAEGAIGATRLASFRTILG
jgi:ribosome biogenesis GTPase